MEKEPISVVVLVKNEELNIGSCLGSVCNWADEIVVVDDESSDRTLEIAQNYTDRLYLRKMSNEGRQRNWAYAQTRNEWILSLDADESVTDGLKREIDAVLSGTQHSAFSAPRRNYIGSYWLKHGGLYPASQLKLFKKGLFRYEEAAVHPRAFVISGTTGVLKEDIIHKSYRDFEHYISKLNRQTTLEAQKWVANRVNMTRGRIIRRAVDRFIRGYLRKKGFKDGFYGFMFAYFASLYQILSYAKYREIKGNGR